jgi:predicted phage terminase large subunit-like protein
MRTDLYYLLRYGLRRTDLERQWLLDRCREVQAQPNGMLDLWAREHYKSTIITFALTIQNVLCDPEITVGIFSHTRPNAKGFLRQIKREFEGNALLQELFPDVLWANPSKDAPTWSEDGGLVVQRKGNPKEATIEAHGLVDGQPTGKHFALLVYDDVVTIDSVTSPEMIHKTTNALALSYNLGADGGQRRMIGTRYDYADTYREVIGRGSFEVRKHAVTVDGTEDGEPVLLSREKVAEKRRDMGAYVFSCQMLLNPSGDKSREFKRDWLRWYQNSLSGEGMNVYIIVDPAGEKKKTSDRTAMWVVGLNNDGNYYLLDFLYDRLNLTERARELMRLHRKWKPMRVGYEKYGKDSDIEAVKIVQAHENYRFDIVPLGGTLKKEDRIRRLVPLFEAGKVYAPPTMHRTLSDGRTVDILEQFLVEEYDRFPVGAHDDGMDCLARITDPDMNATFPLLDAEPERYSKRRTNGSAWAA